jgi:hypothetical protein
LQNGAASIQSLRPAAPSGKRDDVARDITRSLSSDDLDRDDLQDAARELCRALDEVGLDAPLAPKPRSRACRSFRLSCV